MSKQRRQRKPAPPAKQRREPEPEQRQLTYEYLVKAAVAKFGYPVGDGLAMVVPLIDDSQVVVSAEQVGDYLNVRLDSVTKPASAEDKIAALEARVEGLLQQLSSVQNQMAPSPAVDDPDQDELDEMVRRGRAQ